MNKSKFIISILLFVTYFYSFTGNAQELELEYEFLFEMTALLDETIEIGNTPLGGRYIYPVSSGSFEGPKIKGKLLANGGDWLLMMDSTTAKLDIRAVLETDEGETIYIHYGGFIHHYPDGSYYFRTNPGQRNCYPLRR